jgi:hypothetical protein
MRGIVQNEISCSRLSRRTSETCRSVAARYSAVALILLALAELGVGWR